MRKLKLRKSPIHGNGVFAATDIAAEVELIEYKGRLRTHAETDRLYDGSTDTGHTFLFTLNERYVVDANVDGNWARWINHSCMPNCRAVVVESPSGEPRKDRVMIESIRSIKANEELTYDYGIVLDEPHTSRLKRIWACRCGASDCSGTMLKPKTQRSSR